MNASTYAFKLIEHFEQRFDRIEALLGQLVETKDDRDAMRALIVDFTARGKSMQEAVDRAKALPTV